VGGCVPSWAGCARAARRAGKGSAVGEGRGGLGTPALDDVRVVSGCISAAAAPVAAVPAGCSGWKQLHSVVVRILRAGVNTSRLGACGGR